ncbi:hypothetical protein GCM10018773_30170 [Streptomyces candidus]|nr:hypothetical protein GCM10018773_30170 [Streptomyces candidus]
MTFTTSYQQAKTDWEAPHVTLRGRPGQRVELEIPPMKAHLLDRPGQAPRALRLVLPEGTTAHLSPPPRHGTRGVPRGVGGVAGSVGCGGRPICDHEQDDGAVLAPVRWRGELDRSGCRHA